MNLRRLVAEAGFEYAGLTQAVKDGTLSAELEEIGAGKEDIAEIERLVREHFDLVVGKEGAEKSTNEAVNGT